MNPEIIEEKVSNKEVVLLDVRENDEWENGHIKGAIHIPLHELEDKNLADLSKESEIYTYCQSGGRSEEAKEILESLGFSKVINIGGIVQWQGSGGKLVK